MFKNFSLLRIILEIKEYNILYNTAIIKLYPGSAITSYNKINLLKGNRMEWEDKLYFIVHSPMSIPKIYLNTKRCST